MSRNTVQTDEYGTANLIEHIHRTSLRGPAARLQWSRELVQNELDAGADRILVDGYQYLPGVELMRVSGNGSGMTEDRLRSRLTSIGVPDDRSRNFGVGARFATLPENHSGVTWTSIVPEDQDGALVTIHYDRGRFAFQHRDGSDGERLVDEETGELSTVFLPWNGAIPAFVQRSKHGTAVILHGSRREESTYTLRRAAEVYTYLCRRYWRLPAKVNVEGANPAAVNPTLTVVPLEDWLDRYSEASGTVAVPGASIDWYVLKPGERRRGASIVKSMAADFVGLRVGSEIVEKRERAELERFGIYGKATRGRVVLVVEPDKAELDLTRSRAVSASGEALPWAAWREAFVAEMPEEIRALLPSTTIGLDFEAALAKLFDRNFLDRVNASLAHIAHQSGTLSVVETGGTYTGAVPSTTPETERPEPEEAEEPEDRTPTPPTTPRKSARPGDGKRGSESSRPAFPIPRPIHDPEDWPESFHPGTFAGYIAASNEAFLLCTDPILDVTTAEAASRHRERPASMVRSAAESAMLVELSAKIVHAQVRFRRDRSWTEDDLEGVLDARSLSMSLLGFHALDSWVDETVATMVREERAG